MQVLPSKLLVVLARHAERDYIANLPDPEQPLTQKGQRTAYALGEKLAQRLTNTPVPFVFSSPYRRCQQTAHLLATYLSPKAGVRSVDSLAVSPDEQASEAVGWTLRLLASNLEAGCLVLVGHQPEILVISQRLSGTALLLRPGEAAGLELSPKDGLWQVGTAQLLWRLKG